MSLTASSHSEESVGSIPRIVVEGLLHRAELAGLELREARTHAAGTAVLAVVAVAVALLAGFAGTIAVAAAVWDSPKRSGILGLLSLAYLLGAACLSWWTARRLKTWRPLSETIYQLREDSSCLHRFLSMNSR